VTVTHFNEQQLEIKTDYTGYTAHKLLHLLAFRVFSTRALYAAMPEVWARCNSSSCVPCEKIRSVQWGSHVRRVIVQCSGACHPPKSLFIKWYHKLFSATHHCSLQTSASDHNNKTSDSERVPSLTNLHAVVNVFHIQKREDQGVYIKWKR
jgi:hypothetical protein